MMMLLEMPESCYYHKHLMYNAGIVAANGEIVVVCDSDSMAKSTLAESIIKVFDENEKVVLHLDQFRNNRHDLYPFCYPSIDEVTGYGCINYQEGKTTGLMAKEDVLHNRNYGACFCARREDLIKIGGADEHIDFLGHICGPYDFTFRLINSGCKEIWHDTEFLYHTWHPGQAGGDDYMGPHDGKHISTTSTNALLSKRIKPNVINAAIEAVAEGSSVPPDLLNQRFINPEYFELFKFEELKKTKQLKEIAEKNYQHLVYKGFKIKRIKDRLEAELLASNILIEDHALLADYSFSVLTLAEAQKKIDKMSSFGLFAIHFICQGLFFVLNIFCSGSRGKRSLKRILEQYFNSIFFFIEDGFYAQKRFFKAAYQKIKKSPGFVVEAVSQVLADPIYFLRKASKRIGMIFSIFFWRQVLRNLGWLFKSIGRTIKAVFLFVIAIPMRCVRNIGSFVKAFFIKIQKIFQMTSNDTRALYHLIVNLHALAKHRNIPVTLLLDNKRVYFVVKAFQRYLFKNNLQVIRVKSDQEMKDLCENKKRPLDYLILSVNLFLQYQRLMSKHLKENKIAIF